MKTACCSADTLLCDGGALERPRYFPRQLVSDTELSLDQQYFRDKLRRHNRLLHGWGVVCGALVCPYIPTQGGPIEPWKVVVEPGYVLGPYGDEILIECPTVVDLRTQGTTCMSGEGGGDVSDPWCSESFVHCEDAGEYYIAIKYAQCPTRPVRVQPIGCGCDDTACEYSRWRDGYEIGVLRECPTPSNKPYPVLEWCEKGKDPHHTRHVPACPPCPTEPWVGLAQVTVDKKGRVKIDNCTCRRLVASFSRFWWACESTSGGHHLKVTQDPSTLQRGKPGKLTAEGLNPNAPVRIACDDQITITDIAPATHGTNAVEVSLYVRPDATVGPHTLYFVFEDCTVATGTIEVERPTAATCAPEPARPRREDEEESPTHRPRRPRTDPEEPPE